jgi:hypothetical protein
MHRVVLLALLGIPVLIIAQVALFSQPLPLGLTSMSVALDGGRERPVLQGHWQIRESAFIKPVSQRGS